MPPYTAGPLHRWTQKAETRKAGPFAAPFDSDTFGLFVSIADRKGFHVGKTSEQTCLIFRDTIRTWAGAPTREVSFDDCGVTTPGSILLDDTEKCLAIR